MTLNFIMNKYRVLGKKGEGTFSEVLKCQNIHDGTYWACKKMKQHYESIEQVNNLREIQAMRRLSPHQNILELHEVAFDKKSGSLVLICELMDMNIYEMIRGKRHYLPEKRVKYLMYQLLRSINHMHRNGIFHRDVKPENILVKSTAADDHLKLADFGSCRSVYSKPPYTEYISTRWYRAPECLLTDGFYSYKMDIWSVGCVFFEIMSLHPLFPGSNEVDQIAKIHDVMGTPDPTLLNKFRNKTRGMNFNFPTKKGTGIEKLLPHASQDCIELINAMCKYDPDERISAKQSLKHAYFKDLRDAEKRAATQAKLQKQDDLTTASNNNQQQSAIDTTTQAEQQQQQRESELNNNNAANKADVRVNSPSREAPARKEERSKSPRTVRPGSAGGGVLPRYPGSILNHRDPVLQYHKREREKKRRRLKRMAESDSGTQSTGMLPKVPQKPGTYQPPFHSFQTSNNTLPKITAAASTKTTSTYLPSISQAFVHPAKPTKYEGFTASKSRTGGLGNAPPAATKNVYGHYQLPSIDRRGAGY